jgi:adenylate cyclase
VSLNARGRFGNEHGYPPNRGVEGRDLHGRFTSIRDVAQKSQIAARLEGVCEPGAICLSEDAYRHVKGRLDLAVSDLGPTQLKNIAEPIRVYSLRVGVPAG